ncbi:hypothetical protein [Wenzhouxiangella limi]|uniref:Glycosyltransferase RgtA/B/C/D-like domain-containing protein n=1 Tax=Wenzhouxiangella limi TaxID=2707351 RepID=A0A845UUW0_9GAMM|nr:hypothetical protein [Wenzhouxiangella limi]NDY95287.1 hypothetical protein [Wenzhouxiangella limi]
MAELALTEALTLLAFLILPCLAVMLVVSQLLDAKKPGTRSIKIGTALIFGPLMTAPALVTANAIGLRISTSSALTGLFIIALAIYLPTWLAGGKNRVGHSEKRSTAQLPILISERTDRMVIAIMFGLIVLRLASILPDLLLRPVFPWDAWKTWVWKARAWFEIGEIISFANAREWLSAPANVHIVEGTNHPDTISLVMLWSALALGRWDDSLLGLPWIMCTIGTMLSIYGALRSQGLPPVLALIGPYLFVSLPMIATHTALYGYADLWMAALFAVLTVGILQQQMTGGLFGLHLIGASMIFMAFVKDTGSYWIPIIIAALLANALPNRWLFRLGLIGSGIGLSLLALGMDPIAWLTQERFHLDPQSVTAVFSGIARHLLLWHDWHLLGYLLPFIFLAAALVGTQSQPIRSLLILVLMCLAGLLVAFTFSRAGQYAIIGTLFSRMFMHLVPAVIILSTLTAWEWKLAATKGNKECTGPFL